MTGVSHAGERQSLTRLDIRSWRVQLGAILLASLILRVVVVLTSPHFHTFNDSQQYDEDAVQLAVHHDFPASAATFDGGPTAYRPPLFPGVLAVLYKIVGTGSAHTRWEWGRMLEAVLGTLVVLLVFLLARRMFSTRVALVAALITAFYPPLVMANSSLLSESVFIPPVLAAAWMAFEYRASGTLWWAAGAGACVALSALARGNGLELEIPLWFLLWTQRPRFSWAGLKPPLVSLLALIIVVTPWEVRNFEQFHQFVPITTEAGYAVAGTYSDLAQHHAKYPALWSTPLLQVYEAFKKNPHINEEQVSEQLTTDGLNYIKAHPISIPRTLFWNTIRDFNLAPGIETYLGPFEGYPQCLVYASIGAFWVLTLLCLAALASLVIRRRSAFTATLAPVRAALRGAPLSLWGFPLVVFLTTVPWLGLTRYRVPADPFLILVGALVILALWDRVRDTAAVDPVPSPAA